MLDILKAVRETLRQTDEVLTVLAESEAFPVNNPATTIPAADRIYRNRIPRDTIAASDTFHPPKVIVLRQAGGFGQSDFLPIEGIRIDVLTYGESSREADRLRRAVQNRFKYLERETFLDVLIHHINRAGGTVPLTDPGIEWPAMSVAYTILADVEDAA